MAEIQQVPEGVHHHRRRRRKHRKLKRRLIQFATVLIFFLAWGFGVMRLTQYLGKKNELGKRTYDLDPAAFDKEAHSNRPF
jgi:hypothetical protein